MHCRQVCDGYLAQQVRVLALLNVVVRATIAPTDTGETRISAAPF